MSMRRDSHSHRWDRNSYDNVSCRPEPQPISEESIREMVQESIRDIMEVPENMVIPAKVKVEEIPKINLPYGSLNSRKLRIRR